MRLVASARHETSMKTVALVASTLSDAVTVEGTGTMNVRFVVDGKKEPVFEQRVYQSATPVVETRYLPEPMVVHEQTTTPLAQTQLFPTVYVQEQQPISNVLNGAQSCFECVRGHQEPTPVVQVPTPKTVDGWRIFVNNFTPHVTPEVEAFPKTFGEMMNKAFTAASIVEAQTFFKANFEMLRCRFLAYMTNNFPKYQDLAVLSDPDLLVTWFAHGGHLHEEDIRGHQSVINQLASAHAEHIFELNSKILYPEAEKMVKPTPAAAKEAQKDDDEDLTTDDVSVTDVDEVEVFDW